MLLVVAVVVPAQVTSPPGTGGGSSNGITYTTQSQTPGALTLNWRVAR